jgi:Na+/proline symporter
MPLWFTILCTGTLTTIYTAFGGMRAVIWTDVIQFGIFMFGGLLAFGWLVGHLGFDTIWQINSAAGPDGNIDKLRVFDFTFPWDSPLLHYTFWVGVIAMPFQNFAAFGTDQLNAQRIFCCGSEKDAKKAMIWSSVSLLTTLLMLAVGSGLFAWYAVKGLSPDEAAKFAENPNFVFPVWITTVLPPGLTGLILAGAFAAAISSLDSVLAALSQTSLSAIYGREKLEKEADGKRMVFRSRMAVLIWAVILSGVAILLAGGYAQSDNKNLIDLAFGMVAYTYGPLLGVLLAAILPGRRNLYGLYAGVAVSIIIVAWIRPELGQILTAMKLTGLADILADIRPEIAFPWFYPINGAITFLGACLPFGGKLTNTAK